MIMEIADKIKLNLPSGVVVDLEMSPQFLQNLRSTLSLDESVQISERHIKTFLVGSMKNALAED